MTSLEDAWEALDQRQDEEDEVLVEAEKASDAMLRNRAWLGREFLTWLLVKSESSRAWIHVQGSALSVLFVGPVVLQGVSTDATEVRAKGVQAAYSEMTKEAVCRGLLVHQARLRLSIEEQIFEVTLDAECLFHRSVRIPKLMTEEGDDKLSERFYLVDRAADLVDALWRLFLEKRQGAGWRRTEVAAIRAWCRP